MRIGILSDSHHDRKSIDTVMGMMGNVDHVIHAGDNYSDAKYIAKEFGCKITAVKGNTDMGSGKNETIVEFKGRRVLVTHGHKYHVKRGYQRLYYRALEAEVDIVVFGHTHHAIQFKEAGIVFINPGSTSRPYDGNKRSYAILELDEENFKVEIRYFG